MKGRERGGKKKAFFPSPLLSRCLTTRRRNTLTSIVYVNSSETFMPNLRSNFFFFPFFSQESKSRSKRGGRDSSFRATCVDICLRCQGERNAWAYHLGIGKVERVVELWGWRSSSLISVFNALFCILSLSLSLFSVSLKTVAESGVVRLCSSSLSPRVPRTHLCTPCRVRK